MSVHNRHLLTESSECGDTSFLSVPKSCIAHVIPLSHRAKKHYHNAILIVANFRLMQLMHSTKVISA